MKDIEQKALADFEALVGKVVLVGVVQGYRDERSEEISLAAPVFARILPYDERGLREDVVRWMDHDVIDPVYDIEVLSKHPDIEGLSSTFVYGKTYFADGRTEPAHFAMASDDLVARHVVEGGNWKAPELKLFELALPGFDGGTDETDDLIVWVSAPDASVVEQIIDGADVTFSGEIGSDLENVDYALPADSYALQERIRKASEAYQAPVAGM